MRNYSFRETKIEYSQLVLLSKENLTETMIYRKIKEIIFYGKYFFRICPLIDKDSLFPAKSCNMKVDGPMSSTIWNGPSHIGMISPIMSNPHCSND